MKTLDEKIVKEIREQHDLYINDSVLLSVISQTKQLVLKEILMEMPEVYHNNYEHDCDGCTLLGRWEGIFDCEKVIKDLLK